MCGLTFSHNFNRHRTKPDCKRMEVAQSFLRGVGISFNPSLGVGFSEWLNAFTKIVAKSQMCGWGLLKMVEEHLDLAFLPE